MSQIKEPISAFEKKLDSGQFFMLFEVALPDENSELPIFENIIKKLHKLLSVENKIPVGIAFTDYSDVKTSDFTQFFAEIDENIKDSSCFYLSGKNNSSKNLSLQIQSLLHLKMKNIVAVSGESKHLRKQSSKDKSTIKYLESIHILEQISELQNLFPGTSVNPFKYTPEEIYPQYYKLMKKIRCGANFASVQAGWDMKKLQELKWYLEMRDCHIPLIARTIVLIPELVEEICEQKYPGLVMSDDIAGLFRRENKYGYAQFAAAQWRRLQIFAAGAKLLGYSAVQIAGIERPEHAETAMLKIAEALDEFKNFDDWKVEYLNHLSRAEPAPFPHNYYIFENLMNSQYPETEPKIREVKSIKLSSVEKFKYKICSAIFSRAHRHVPEEYYLSKKILLSCKTCKYCRVPLTFYVCPETCPKGLANGPCGGSFAGGLCEFRDRKCIYSQIFKHAFWQNDLNPLEERIIKPAE